MLLMMVPPHLVKRIRRSRLLSSRSLSFRAHSCKNALKRQSKKLPLKFKLSSLLSISMRVCCLTDLKNSNSGAHKPQKYSSSLSRPDCKCKTTKIWYSQRQSAVHHEIELILQSIRTRRLEQVQQVLQIRKTSEMFLLHLVKWILKHLEICMIASSVEIQAKRRSYKLVMTCTDYVN